MMTRIQTDKNIWADNIFLLSLFVIFLTISLTKNTPHIETFLISDTNGYYTYLPAVFIHKDVHHLTVAEFPVMEKNEKGELFTRFTCGMAYFYLPFFLVAHLYAHIFHIQASGFSAPYCYAIIICGVFWAFVGLYVLKRLLMKYFSRTVTWLTLLCIALGTNFYYYAPVEPGMSHVYNFALFALIISITDQYYEHPTKCKAILAGAILGWITLTRPTNIAILLFLVLYKTTSFADIKARFVFLKKHMKHIMIAAPFFAAVMMPQLFYWKEMTGSWVTWSYGSLGFPYLKHPKIAEVLFDTQNGLFLYAPVLLFLFYGLISERRDMRTNFLGVSIVFVVITYIFASWWAWWFGGAFGHRCYVDYYPVLAFPLAITMEGIVAIRNNFLKAILFFILVLFCYYNMALTQIFMTDGEVWDGPKWRWNWDAWGNLLKKIF